MNIAKLISYICLLVLGLAALVFSIIEFAGNGAVWTCVVKTVLSLFFAGYGAYGVVKYVKTKS